MEKSTDVDRLNRAYLERDRAVILAARMAVCLGLNAGYGLDGNEGWDLEWRTVVYVDLPDGQVSWHMGPGSVELAKSLLPEYPGEWDGKFASRDSEYVKGALPAYTYGVKFDHSFVEVFRGGKWLFSDHSNATRMTLQQALDFTRVHGGSVVILENLQT